jgi:hypothetical protein
MAFSDHLLKVEHGGFSYRKSASKHLDTVTYNVS